MPDPKHGDMEPLPFLAGIWEIVPFLLNWCFTRRADPEDLESLHHGTDWPIREVDK